MPDFLFTPGETPLLISAPHVGTHIPATIAESMTPEALEVPDTDWHMDRLYGFAREMGAGMLMANYSRYVVDLNRDPAGKPLYPGADNTEVCPTARFDRAPIYKDGKAPDAGAVARRVDRYWRPYHDVLDAELRRLKRRFGVALLFDAHSILSRVPRFFEGRLPDLNLGTGSGSSADPRLIETLGDVLRGRNDFSHVVDGRFKGGFITRHYGRPAEGCHAAQLEMALSAYMEESPPWAWRPEQAMRVQEVLRGLLQAMLDWAGAARR
ncbi:MAG: N-formylglutamate deformylase [Alphaproteobacteria bacterium]|nr:N-formylglutamate deformylase [Alphaproteobacteria bacterium]